MEYESPYPLELEQLSQPYSNLQKRLTELTDKLARINLVLDMTLSNDMATERQRMALEAARAPHAWLWLLALPSGHLHNIKACEFEVMLAVRLGYEVEHLQIKQGQANCQCNSALTVDHGMGCASMQGSVVYQRHNRLTAIFCQALAGGECSQIKVEPRGQFAGYGQGSPDFVYRNARNKLVFTDVSVIAARGSANRQHLMTKSLVLAKAREKQKRSENDDRAKRNSADFIPLVFEARGGFGDAALKADRTYDRSIQPWEYNSNFQYYMKAISVALIRGSAQNLLLALQRSH